MDNQGVAPRGPSRVRPRIALLRGVGALVAVVVPTALYSCRSSHFTGAPQGDGVYTPPPVPGQCAVGREGCGCDGQISSVACGRVTNKSGNYITCSTGYSACQNGVWGPCEGDHLVTKSVRGVTAGTGGLRLLQATQPCDDPCDPNGCTLISSDAGDVDAAGVAPGDAGVTIASNLPDACAGLGCQVATNCVPQWFQVDMGGGQADAQPQTFNAITLDNPAGEGDYPRGYEVLVSDDGMNWGSPVATGVGTADSIAITFPQQTARFIRIVQTSSSPPPGFHWWSIHELNVLQNFSDAGPGTPLARGGWTATASENGDLPGNALDRDPITRWTTGVRQHSDSTTIIGTVYDPAGVNPVYNAVVYVPVDPMGALAPLSTGPSCDTCSSQAAIKAVTITQTGPDGTFVLSHAPSNDIGAKYNIPLVVQVGKWRREAILPIVTQCRGTFVSPTESHLPRSSVDGQGGSADIPKIAIATGQHDPFECLLLKMGVDPAEFQVPGGLKRIDYYKGNGVDLAAGAPSESTLVGTTNGGANALSKYDLVLLPCEGNEDDTTNTAADNLVAYANAGGRVLTTHFSYSWLAMPTAGTANANNPVSGNANPYFPIANWTLGSVPPATTTATIDNFPKGQDFAQWLQIVGASTMLGQLPINGPYYDVAGVNPPATEWAKDTGKDAGAIPTLLFSATTPVSGPACGRIVHSDFHLSTADKVDPTNGGACMSSNDCGFTATCNAGTCSAAASTFPLSCKRGADMTPEEDALEFMLLGQTDCISPDTMPPPPPKGQKRYSDVTFTEDFTANCSMVNPDGGPRDAAFIPGTHVVWRELQWRASVPNGASITLSAQTGDPQIDGGPPDWTALQQGDAGTGEEVQLAYVTTTTIVPPPELDVALIDTGTSGSSMPDGGAFDTHGVSSRSILHLKVTLTPTADGTAAPTLQQWNVKADCVPSE